MYLLLHKKKKKFSPSNRLLHSCYHGSSAPQYASLVQFVQSPVNLPTKPDFLMSIYILIYISNLFLFHSTYSIYS